MEPSFYAQSMMVCGETEGPSLQAEAHLSMGGLSYRLQVLEASEFHRSSRKGEVGPGQPGLCLPETLTASQVRNP